MLRRAAVSLLQSRAAGASTSSSPATSTSIDADEIRRFAELSDTWADESGPFKALHSLNQLRVPWILQKLPEERSGVRVADIGCGGGLLSVPLATSGLRVTGVDATEQAVKAAQNWVRSSRLRSDAVGDRLSLVHSSVEQLSEKEPDSFDAVVASEILEHVSDLDGFVSACVRIAKPGAPLFFTTINKTLVSRVTAVWLAEEVLQIVPRGVHDWEKFVEPERLRGILEKEKCAVRGIEGFGYDPVGNRWDWHPFQHVNYALWAVKK